MQQPGEDRRRSFAQTAVVRVDFPSEHMYKKMRFELAITVLQARLEIIDKRNKTVPFTTKVPLDNYGMFCPPGGNLQGQWMQDADPLNYYYVEKRGCIEFKLRPSPLAVKDARGGGEQKFEVDFSVPIANLVPRFVKHFQLPIPDAGYEYGLQRPGIDAFLSSKQSLLEQEVEYGSTVVVKKRFKMHLNSNTTKAVLNKSLNAASKLIGKTKETLTMRKGQGNKVFGVSMVEVLARGTTDIVPLVQKSIEYIEKNALDVEGIFRLSGSATEIQQLKKAFDDGEDVNLEKVRDPHVVCGLLKLYLRELPEPLMTFQLYEPLIAVQACPDKVLQMKYFRSLMNELPQENKVALKRLFAFMVNIIKHQNQNKMAVHNVATVFAPNLLRSQSEAVLIEDTAATNAIVCTLINEASSLFQGNQEFLGVAKAIFDYQSNSEYELNFHLDQILFITKEDDSGWWSGEINGKSGLFPNNYVELIKMFALPQTPAIESRASQPTKEAPKTISRTASAPDVSRGQPPAQQHSQAPQFQLPQQSRLVGQSQVQSQPQTQPQSQSQVQLKAATQAQPKASAQQVRGVPQQSEGGMSKSKFNSELESLKNLYEEEKQARIKLEQLAQNLGQSLTTLQSEVKKLRAANLDLQSKVAQM